MRRTKNKKLLLCCVMVCFAAVVCLALLLFCLALICFALLCLALPCFALLCHDPNANNRCGKHPTPIRKIRDSFALFCRGFFFHSGLWFLCLLKLRCALNVWFCWLW
ncbi:unnamed protein product [Discosporangium mesarthrocarpum]